MRALPSAGLIPDAGASHTSWNMSGRTSTTCMGDRASILSTLSFAAISGVLRATASPIPAADT